jgi:hypothetical protein
MSRSRRALAPWQARWVRLHDELHLLEVLLEAIAPSPEDTGAYWQLSSDVIIFGEDLRAAYDTELAGGGTPPNDASYEALHHRLVHLQARAQALALDNELEW